MSGQVEQHGCIVCGKTHTLKVIYAPGGRVLKCEVTSLGGQRVFDPRRPIVACDTHSAAEIEAAYAKHYPGRQDKEEDEDD
jgi:hypothetical protein